jgi:hypothetical protein
MILGFDYNGDVGRGTRSVFSGEHLLSVLQEPKQSPVEYLLSENGLERQK